MMKTCKQESVTSTYSLDNKSNFKNWHERKPIKELDERGMKMVELMTFGPDEQDAEKYAIQAYEPVNIEQAADIAGLRRRNARWLYSQPVFLSAYAKSLANVRNSMKARAVHTMGQIMDEVGENLAADRTVRLKAASTIIGNEAGNSPNLKVNIHNNPVNLTAGLVIRLPANAPISPLELQKEDIMDREISFDALRFSEEIDIKKIP
jgi:hypothetical protein